MLQTLKNDIYIVSNKIYVIITLNEIYFQDMTNKFLIFSIEIYDVITQIEEIR